MVFHLVTGRWLPACLLAATASVETVSPPEDFLLLKVSNDAPKRQISLSDGPEKSRGG